jgi:hypothetical protein
MSPPFPSRRRRLSANHWHRKQTAVNHLRQGMFPRNACVDRKKQKKNVWGPQTSSSSNFLQKNAATTTQAPLKCINATLLTFPKLNQKRQVNIRFRTREEKNERQV